LASSDNKIKLIFNPEMGVNKLSILRLKDTCCFGEVDVVALLLPGFKLAECFRLQYLVVELIKT
jgi:hypothetical protein